MQLGYCLVLFAWMVAVTQGLDAFAQTEPRKSVAPAETSNPLKELIAGEEFLPPGIRAKQADDFDNPAYASVEQGERIFATPEGSANKSCTSCHQRNSLKLTASSYPKHYSEARRVITLGERVNLCRQKNLQAPAYSDDSEDMLSLVAYLRSQSRGAPSAVSTTGQNAETFKRGSLLYETKIGRLQLSCQQCHNANYGQKFGSDVLSQGHPQAYPVFRVGENRMTSLHERFRMCNALARAEPQSDNSPDYVALELYINWRSKNLPNTSPGVRP